MPTFIMLRRLAPIAVQSPNRSRSSSIPSCGTFARAAAASNVLEAMPRSALAIIPTSSKPTISTTQARFRDHTDLRSRANGDLGRDGMVAFQGRGAADRAAHHFLTSSQDRHTCRERRLEG